MSVESPEATRPTSCESSLSAGENQAGTAPRTDVWLLLEYTRPWAARAFEDSDLPAPVKERLSQHLKAIAHSRIQFIKHDRDLSEHIVFYVAVSRQDEPALYRFDLASYDDLLMLDIPAVAAGAAHHLELRRAEALFLVCTNGRRDACCALHGLPLYKAMSDYGGPAVWQTTHIGGHRFAGTLVCLPQGIYYGRVAPGEAASIVDAHRRGDVVTERCRGRSYHENVAQAAEVLLRQQTGITRLDALRLMSAEPSGERAWTVRFGAAESGAGYVVHIRGEQSAFEVYETTNDPQRKPVMQYHLTACEPF